MKKFLVLIIITVLLLTATLTLAACNNDKDGDFSIEFIVDDAVYATVSTTGNETITMPDNPTKEGYTFGGWYWDKDTWQNEFTAVSLSNQALAENIKIYAKWDDSLKGNDENGTSVEWADWILAPPSSAEELLTFLEHLGYESMQGDSFADFSVRIANNARHEEVSVKYFSTEEEASQFYQQSKATLDELIDANNGRAGDYGVFVENVVEDNMFYGTYENGIVASYHLSGKVFILSIIFHCGYTDDEESGLRYYLRGRKDGYNVGGIRDIHYVNTEKTYIYQTSGNIIVPEEYNGKAVLGINEAGFYKCVGLTGVEIPDTVTCIDYDSFSECTSLDNIFISKSISKIGSNAFYKCENLTIYCEAETQPLGWDAQWNWTGYGDVYFDVVWGWKLTGDK